MVSTNNGYNVKDSGCGVIADAVAVHELPSQYNRGLEGCCSDVKIFANLTLERNGHGITE
jgi:hypothetical protein